VAGELQLALAYELTPENAPRFAADIVAQAASQGIELDYSPATLDYLDSVTASLRAGGVTVEQIPEVLFSFGCVLGECVIMAVGGSWTAARFDVPIGVRTDATTLDPVGFAFAALASGRTYAGFLAAIS
jgi:hypothetical protein